MKATIYGNMALCFVPCGFLFFLDFEITLMKKKQKTPGAQ